MKSNTEAEIKRLTKRFTSELMPLIRRGIQEEAERRTKPRRRKKR